MARPMPREAPVTSATLLSRVESMAGFSFRNGSAAGAFLPDSAGRCYRAAPRGRVSPKIEARTISVASGPCNATGAAPEGTLGGVHGARSGPPDT
jgi:hypothetical protein